MYPHAPKCQHGAMPTELVPFANTYYIYNLRAFYCQECLRHDPHRSTTQAQFKRLCQQLQTHSLGLGLQAVPEEQQVDGAVDADPAPPSHLPAVLRHSLCRLRGHLKTPAQKRREHQRVDEQRLISAFLASRRIRGKAATDMLVVRMITDENNGAGQAQVPHQSSAMEPRDPRTSGTTRLTGGLEQKRVVRRIVGVGNVVMRTFRKNPEPVHSGGLFNFGKTLLQKRRNSSATTHERVFLPAPRIE